MEQAVEDALGVLVQSRARARESRRLLSQTRQRIAVGRRRLNPWFAVSGSSDDDRLRATVRARLESGALFPVNGHSVAGSGSGKPCAVCGSPIGEAEIADEVQNGPNGVVSTHLACYVIWIRESEAWHQGRQSGVNGTLLGTLHETHADHIVLSDHTRIFLTPPTRCTHPAGTRLLVIYRETEGKKTALSIQRYLWG